MGTKKHEIVNKLAEFCADNNGYVIVQVANREVGEDAMNLLKGALQHNQPVSFKLKEIKGGEAISVDLNVKDLKNGIFTALDDSNGVVKIRRFPLDGLELCGKHICFPKAFHADKFDELRRDLLNA